MRAFAGACPRWCVPSLVRASLMLSNLGMTVISHNNLGKKDITSCQQVECFNLTMKYNATKSQMVSLIDVSQSCQQMIQVIYLFFKFFSGFKI
jgi:hypothetical protein